MSMVQVWRRAMALAFLGALVWANAPAPAQAQVNQPPSVPRNVAVTAGNGQLTVTWDAATSAGTNNLGFPASLDSYQVRWKLVSATNYGEDDVIDQFSVNMRSVVIPSLMNGAAYDVQVRTWNNSDRSSAWTTAVQGTPAGPPDAPTAPGSVIAGDGQLIVSGWSAPTNNGGSEITGYAVEWKLTSAMDADYTDNNVALATFPATSATITMLTNGSAYNVRVSAVNVIAPGPPSPAITATPAASSAPDAPTALMLTSSASAQLTASWSAPVNQGSEAITGYEVQYRLANQNPAATYGSSNIAIDDLPATSATISSLTNGSLYDVQVRAVNRQGVSAWTAAAQGAPVGLPAQLDPPLVQRVGTGRLFASWSAASSLGGGQFLRYELRWKLVSAGSYPAGNLLTPSDSLSAIASLTNGEAYEVQVRVITRNPGTNAEVEGPWSDATQATPAIEPSTPTGVTATAGTGETDRNTMTVSWTAPNNGGNAITEYQVEYQIGENGATATATQDNPATTSLKISSLTKSTQYRARVRAVNDVGEGAYSAWTTPLVTVLGVPDAPTTPSLTAADMALEVTWTAPSETGGSAITGYDVEWKLPTETSWTDASHSGTDAEITISSLTNQQNYNVRVRATNAQGASAWSPTATLAAGLLTAPATPAAPTLSVRNTELGVSWDEPNTGGSAITDYDVRWRTASSAPGGSWTELDDSSASTDRTATITSLDNGTAYQVQVRATNAQGDSAWGATASATPATVPGVPTRRRIFAGDEKLTVDWLAPDSNGGSAVTGYQVEWKLASAPNTAWSSANVVFTPSGVQADIGSLTNGQNYNVRVRATNSIGNSAWSTPLSGTPVGVPDAPTGVTATAGTGAAGIGRLTVSWTAPTDTGGAAISRYELQYQVGTNGATGTGTQSNPAMTSIIFTGLTKNARYRVRVQAVNSSGVGAFSDWSAFATVLGVPDAPAAPTLTAGDTTLMVEWAAPSNNGGSAITDYDVQYKLTSASDWTDASHSGTGTSITISSLQNGMQYDVQVRAANTQGTGPWSATAQARPGTAPDAPAIPTIMPGAGQLSVSWTAPDNKGNTITAYEVQRKLATEADTEYSASGVTITGTTAEIISLTNNVAYNVRVRATNALGTGDWSPVASGTPVTVPSGPRNVIVAVGSNQLTVSWEAPASTGGSALTGYELQYKLTSASQWQSDDTLSAITFSSGFTAVNGMQYDVRVRAVNAQGNGVWSSVVQATPATVPGVPTNVSVAPSNTQLTVTWEAPASDGGSAVTGYFIEWKLASAGAYVNQAGEGATDRTHTIENLMNGMAYDVRVLAANAQGNGAWSAELQATPANLPGAPTLLGIPVPGDGTLSGVFDGPGSDGGSAITHWETGYRIANSGDAYQIVRRANTGRSSENYFLEGLTNGQNYEIRFRAVNAVGAGPWSPASFRIPSGPAGPPGNVGISFGNRQLRVAWDAPADNGGRAIRFYRVRWKLASAGSYPSDNAFSGTSGSQRAHTITGLTPGSTYDVQVQANNRADATDGEWSPEVQGTVPRPTDAPAAPSLTPGDQQIEVSWQAPANTGDGAVTDYDVQQKLASASVWTDVAHSGTGTSLTISSLINGEAYDVRVRATNDTGAISDWSAAAQATPAGPPTAPQSLIAAPASGEVGMIWAAPANDGGSAIARYEVEYRTGSASYGSANVEIIDTTASITMLTNGSTYDVRVRAVNALSAGPWATAQATPSGPPDAPAAPSVGSANGGVSVSWVAPNDGGNAITAYQLRWKLASEAAYPPANLFTSNTGTTTSATLPNLRNGSTYDVQVRARNAAGTGEWSPAAQGTPRGDPDAPVITVAPGDEMLTVSWQAPNDGGFSLVGYTLRWKMASATSYTQSTTTSLTYTITPLTNGETYDVQVLARNTNSLGPWSAVVQATPLDAPAKVTPGAPSVVVDDEGDAGTLDVSWTAPATHPLAPVSDYDVRYKLRSAASWTDLPFTGTGTSAEITGLQDNQPYEVQVRASNDFDGNADFAAVSGPGAWSVSGSATTLTPTAPAAPAAPDVEMSSREGMLLVSWTEPALRTGNLPILNYVVEWKLMSAPDADYSSVGVSISGLSATIRGLAEDSMDYSVRVFARNRVGESSWSSIGSGTSLMPTAPSTPSAPTLASGASGVLSVSWRAPADGGSVITGYEVEYKLTAAPATAWGSDNVSISGLSATITELEEGEEYQVRVRATNRIDESPWSAIATGSPSSSQRNARTTSRALSQTGNAVAAGAIDVLGGQLGAAVGGGAASGAASGAAGGAGGAAGGAGTGGNQSNFTIAGLNITPGYNARTALPVLTHADEAAPKHNFALSDLLQLGAFRVSLFHDKNKDKSKKRRARPATSAPSKWAIWGRGNVRGFASETDAGLELDGNAYAGWLGVDYTHSRSLMGGLAVSYDESRTDYTDPEFGGGEVSTRLGSFYPYLRISPTEALDLWGLMGFGWGDLSFSGEGQEDTSTDMSLQVYALGAQLKLIDLYGAQFSLKSDASFAILETASQANLPGIRTEPSRMRFALAAQYPWQIDSVSRVTPSVELGGRLDFNEVSGGAGMELGGAVNYNHSTLRLNAEARARGLVYHNDPNVQDWGVSFQLRVDPNQFGQGLFASFAPHWGQSQSRVQRLWRDLDAPQGLAQDMSLQPHQMEAEFGYGFALPRMKATLSPFGRTRFAQTGAQTFSLGSRLQLGDMKLELTGEQQTAPTDHRMSLHFSMPLGR